MTDCTVDTVENLARTIGFDYVGHVSAEALSVHPEVRDMCAADRCHHYGRNWACPPACGPLEQFEAELRRRTSAVLVQSVGPIGDGFDFEAIMEIQAVHKERFMRLREELLERSGDAGLDSLPLFLGAGSCDLCAQCAYPEPCRHPDSALVSMEAAGLVVSDACTAAGIGYNHGAGTMSFTCCVLF